MLSDRLQQVSAHLPKGVHLLAVSKGHPITSIKSFLDLGQCDFGESRLQEALPKLIALQEFEQLRWHFIGKLQKNKIRRVVRSFAFIHSVDSFDLAQRVSRIAGEENKSPKVMIQVKFREDPTKGGFDPENLCKEWPNLAVLPHMRIVGLMTMSPISVESEERRTLFRECRQLANQLQLPECSMGMSSDWKEALQAGATWLRLGSSLFGQRPNHFNLNTDITKSS